MKNLYSDSLTVLEARRLYFKNSGFDESTYTDKWVRLPVLGFTLSLPNLKPRRAAVPFHDIDHILTEYKTDWLGEWQISAYELGTGCGNYWAAWLINFQAALGGALRAPKASVEAFARGRKSKGVYGYKSHEPLLKQNLGQLRQETTAQVGSTKADLSDIALFYTLVFISLAVHALPLIIAVSLISSII